MKKVRMNYKMFLDLKKNYKKESIKSKRKGTLKKKVTKLIFGLTSIMFLIFIIFVAKISKEIVTNKSNNELKNYSEQIYSLVETSVDSTINNYLQGALDIVDKKIINEFYTLNKEGSASKEFMITKIIDIVKEIKLADSGNAYILNKEGIYLYHPNNVDKNVLNLSYIKEIIINKTGILSYISEEKSSDTLTDIRKVSNIYSSVMELMEKVIDGYCQEILDRPQ